MGTERAKGVVVGDADVKRYIYIEALPDVEANLHEAWVDAKDFVEVNLEGGAALLERLLGWPYLGRRTDEGREPEMKSLYLLNKGARDGRVWEVGLAVVSGERLAEYQVMTPADLGEPGLPVVVVDFRQGWVNSNRNGLAELLKGRRYLVRTHDPTSAEVMGQAGDLWAEVRAAAPEPGVWFSPWQDMDGGALRMAGNWRSVCGIIVKHLQERGGPNLWDEQRGWRQHVVVQVRMDGMLVLSPSEDDQHPRGHETILSYPGAQPGSFERVKHGTVIGGGVVIVAALARALGAGPLTHKRVCDAAALGLARARRLVEMGYSEPPVPAGVVRDLPPGWNVYPGEAIEGSDFDELPVPYDPPGDCLASARKLLAASDKEFRRMTVFSLGRLFTCDEKFAEQLIRLESRIAAHLKARSGVLSVAIFGNPGSGKSFAAEEVLASIGEPLKKISFNVSQFTSGEMLVDALKQVQAESLQGKVPFVFWDEFDCVFEGVVGGWLSRFLMPMQDAKFWDGADMASLGKCVFVFVGSAWSDGQEFDRWAKDPECPSPKGRDFQSRLDRILEVPSIELPGAGRPADGCPYLNRALMIRVVLSGKGIRLIDENVVEFLLQAKYRHGMRSMKTIIEASQLGKTSRFSAYHLPPEEVLQVHVEDGRPAPASDGPPLELQWR